MQSKPEERQHKDVSHHPKHESRTEFLTSSVDSTAHLKRTKTAFKGKRAMVDEIAATFDRLEKITYVSSRTGYVAITASRVEPDWTSERYMTHLQIRKAEFLLLGCLRLPLHRKAMLSPDSTEH